MISLCRALWAWQLVTWRPSWPRRLRSPTLALQRTHQFAREYSATSVVTYVAQNIDRVMLGVTGGPHAIGLYDNAYRWALYPVQQLYPPLLPVAVAGLSRARDDVAQYRRYWGLAVLLVLSAMVPGSALVAIEADAVIRTLLGNRWIEAVPVFRLVAIGSIAVALSRHSRWLFLSEGRTARQLRYSILQLGVTAIAMAIGVRWGVPGVAAAYAITRWSLVVPELGIAFHGSRIGWRDFLTVAFRPVVATAVAAAVLLVLRIVLPTAPLPHLLGAAAMFAATYLASWVGLPGGWRALRELVGLARRLRGGPHDSAEPTIARCIAGAAPERDPGDRSLLPLPAAHAVAPVGADRAGSHRDPDRRSRGSESGRHAARCVVAVLGTPGAPGR